MLIIKNNDVLKKYSLDLFGNKLSKIQSEEEILIPPWIRMQIKKIKPKSPKWIEKVKTI